MGKFVDRIFAVIGATILSQAPFFMQQYTQQLSGHVVELQNQMNSMQNAAAQSGKNLPQFIRKFIENTDVDFARQGEIMQSIVDRGMNLTDALTSLQHTGVFTKPFVFISHFNWGIAKATWKSFKFGFAFSTESVIYALAGVCLGYLTFRILTIITSLIFKKAISACKIRNLQP